MSKSNREIRIKLARIFGSGCMFQKSHAEEYIKKIGTIKTYKQFKNETHYKSKKVKALQSLMTLHHLQHTSENGDTTVNNCIIINQLAHRYIHSLPREQEEIINDYIREWKKMNYQKCKIQQVNYIQAEFEIELAEIETGKSLIVRPLNRAKVKQNTKRAYEEYLKEIIKE